VRPSRPGRPCRVRPCRPSTAAKKALVVFWSAWEQSLTPSASSTRPAAAGLPREAFDYLFREYRKVEATSPPSAAPIIIPVERTLLTENLFGMDLNAEAVEIARLSFWIKDRPQGGSADESGRERAAGEQPLGRTRSPAYCLEETIPQGIRARRV